MCGAPWLAGGVLGCSWVLRCILCLQGLLGWRWTCCPGFEAGVFLVALQHRADRAAAYVRACLWLWRINAPSVTKLHSSTLLTLIIGDPSTPTLSQEIDIPLPNPVSTPPSAQIPPPPTQTPPGADIASQRQGNTQPAGDEDVPMPSQMAERTSSPRMEDVVSSQDIQGGAADADGKDEDEGKDAPSSRRHNHPARKKSGPDGSSFTHMPLSVFHQ